MDIAFATDNYYAPVISVALISLVENNSDADQIIFHILDNGISDEYKRYLCDSVSKENVSVFFYDVSPYLEKLKKQKLPKYGVDSSCSIWARLFLPDILPSSISKVLYLDCDVIVLESLEPLFSCENNNSVVGGVLDLGQMPTRNRIGLSKEDVYINTGVLLMDLNRWRMDNYSERIIDYYISNNHKLIFPDQDALNVCLRGNIALFSQKYNFTIFDRIYFASLKFHLGTEYKIIESLYGIKEAKKQPVIFHFAAFQHYRPWNNGVVYKRKWLKYYKKSPFYSVVSLPITPIHSWMYKSRNILISFHLFTPLHALRSKLLHKF